MSDRILKAVEFIAQTAFAAPAMTEAELGAAMARIARQCEAITAALASAPQASQPPQGAEPPTDWEAAYRQFADGPAFGPEVPALKKAFAAGMAWQASQSEGALRAIMRAADAAKEPCGMGPESPAAIRNGKFATIAQIAAQGLGLVRGPSPAAPPQGASSLLPEQERVALVEKCALEVVGFCNQFGDEATDRLLMLRSQLAASPLPAPQEPARVCGWSVSTSRKP